MRSCKFELHCRLGKVFVIGNQKIHSNKKIKYDLKIACLQYHLYTKNMCLSGD